MKIVYGVQGPAEKVAALVLPAGAHAVRLAYDAPLAAAQVEVGIFAPSTTWGTGRNTIGAAISVLHPDADYVVMLDHDIVFRKGSFEAFEAALARTRPAVAFPLMPKALASPTLLSDRPVQRAIALDEQMVAIHRSVLGTPGVFPLVTTYDWASWYVASFIFEYTCSLSLGSAVHQYNDIEISNDDHAWEHGGNTAYWRGDHNKFLHLVYDALGAMHGGYDPIHIEQIDFAGDEHRRAARRAKAAIMTTRDGQPLEA